MKTKPVIILESMIIICDGSKLYIPAEKLYFSAEEHPCDICGSHGSIEIAFECPKCSKLHTLVVKDW